MDLMKYTAVALGKKIKAGEVTVKEAAQAALDQIKKSEERPIRRWRPLSII